MRPMKRRNVPFAIAGLTILAFVPLRPATAGSPGERVDRHSAQQAQRADSPGVSAAEARPRSRLKFKDGPVCMCARPLGERDIAAGRAVPER